MSQPCSNCTSPATLYLCPRCITELHDMLQGLPVWIGYLQNAAWGETKLGQSERRSSDQGSPMLINLRASQQLEYTRSVLLEWLRDITAADGLEEFARTELLATWLQRHTHDIARDKHAHICLREIKELIDDIGRIINRPEPPRMLGPCPRTLTDNYGHRICNTALTAKPGDIETQCVGCKTTYNIEQLMPQQIRLTDGMSFTMSQLYHEILPAWNDYIPQRTLQHWAASGRLQPSGYDGTEPRYQLSDVRHLMNSKLQKHPTGAQAHKARTS